MKKPTRNQLFAAVVAVLLTAQAAFINTSQAQVTFQQVTNGLIDYYPMNTVLPGNITPDLISRRDFSLVNMTAANIVTVGHPGIESSSNCLYFNQSGGPTIAHYETTGQNPLDGSGDFLPFINQRGATMNFWVNGNAGVIGSELRVFAECANNGESDPFFSLSGTAASTLGHYFIRDSANATDPNGVSVIKLTDGTYQLPAPGYYWVQGNNESTNGFLDGNWHMVTMTIETNGDIHLFVDGNYDPGAQVGGPFTDSLGNPAVGSPIWTTNWYYTTNIYPAAGVSNPPPRGFVRWMMNGIYNTGSTTFGGFRRNGAIGGGLVSYISDIGYWNRVLSTNEILFVMTNGLPGLTLNTNQMTIQSWTAGFAELAQGDSVNLSWQVLNATNVSIPGVGTTLPAVGSANVPLPGTGTYSFTLTAQNGLVAPISQTISVKSFPGVSSAWHLIQRWDGLFTPTAQGVNGSGVTTLSSIFSGAIDRWNVVSVNGNESISAKSGYKADSSSSLGFDTAGSITYAALNNLTIPPAQQNTLFFRFSIHDPGSFNSSMGIVSGMDFVAGVTDFGFATGPVGGGGTLGVGNGGAYGPGFHIVRADGNYLPSPFDLTAVDYSGSAVTNSYSYISSVDPNGLMTNVNYMVWLDISNNYTAENISGGTTNTINEPLFSMWLQKPGDSSRTLLFSGFHGDRDFSQYGINQDFPSPYLNKVFVSMASEAFQSGDTGAFFETNNMILVDDFYLSKNGLNSTIPKLLNLSSLVRGGSSATITWNSLGSLFQTNTYSVQRTFSLSPPAWTTLVSGLPSGGDTTTYTDSTVGSASQAFYRVTWP